MQVGQVGRAVGTADRLEVEVDVLLPRLVVHLEEVTAQLLARQTGQPLAPPDGAERVLAAVALLHGLAQRPLQGVRTAQGLLHPRHFGVASGRRPG